jgi:peptide-methionine (R)-S-oxide reductase
MAQQMTDTTPAAPRQKVHKTEAEWRELLTPDQFHVMREKGTEPPFTGTLVNNHADGVYR